MFIGVEQLEVRRFLSANHGVGHAHGHAKPEDHSGHGKGHAATPPAHNAVVMHGRNLQVKGSGGDDVVSVVPNADDPTKVDVSFNGTVSTFSLTRIKQLQVDLKAGNDTLTVDPSLTFKLHASGGDGDDNLSAGGGQSKLMGGSGDDVLVGGPLNDALNGGSGNDMLDGGDGHDRLDGKSGTDSVTGGDGSDHFAGDDDASEKLDVTSDDHDKSHTSDDDQDGSSGDTTDTPTDPVTAV